MKKKYNMIHYTINTGHKFKTSAKEYDTKLLINSIGGIVRRAIYEKSLRERLPVFSRYEIELNYEEGGVIMWIFDDEGKPLTVSGGIWQKKGVDFVRKKMNEICEWIEPEKIPWIGTYVFPNLNIVEASPWIADCEQSFFVCFIELEKEVKNRKEKI